MGGKPTLNKSDVVRLLLSAGWESVNQVGSHEKFKHREIQGSVTVAGHGNKPIKEGTLRSIFNQASLADVPRQLQKGASLKQIEKSLKADSRVPA